jgi:hypothetical protein
MRYTNFSQNRKFIRDTNHQLLQISTFLTKYRYNRKNSQNIIENIALHKSTGFIGNIGRI